MVKIQCEWVCGYLTLKRLNKLSLKVKVAQAILESEVVGYGTSKKDQLHYMGRIISLRYA